MTGEWTLLTELLGAFTGERNAQRWAASLPPALTSKESGAWLVSPAALLPAVAGKPPQTVKAFLVSGGRGPDLLDGHRVPSGALDWWTEKDRARFLATHELLKRQGECCLRLRGLAQGAFDAAFEAEHGEWARSVGLRADARTLYRYQRAVNPASGPAFTGNVDGRGRSRGAPAECSPDAWQLFKSLFVAEGGLTLAAAWRFVAGQAGLNGWAWPSLSAVRDRVRREIPEPAIVLAREGLQRFRADCLPTMERGLDEIPAGVHWVGDERTLDLFCRVPDARHGWRAIRPKLTAWSDMRSRAFVGWQLGERANSDTILGAFKSGALGYGLPAEITIDNGKDYRAVGGPRCGRKWDEFDTDRLKGLSQLGIQTHYAEPFTPRAKPIESLYDLVKEEFDRCWRTFCGGKPAEKPATLNARIKNVMALPTLEEVRAGFGEFLKGYHATPRHAWGDLSPNLIMEQYRGPVRLADPALLELLCCRLIGPVKVSRAGVRYRGLLYGTFDEAVFKLQGREVWLRIDPARADAVVVCDRRGVPIVVATNQRLSGATSEDVRKAAEHRGRLTKATRTYLDGRSFILDSKPGQIMHLKRKAAERAEAEVRKTLPAAADPPAVHVVRPDISAALKKLRPPKPAAGATDNVFDRLAEVQGGNPQPATEERFDWAGYHPSERMDAPPEDVFAELAERFSSAG